MVKIYKYNNKLAIFLPFDVIKELGLSENDEVEFFRFKGNSYLFAKKSDIADLLVGEKQQQAIRKPPSQSAAEKPVLNEEEISVLKKLDTIRYNQRTQANVEKLLDSKERDTLRQLMKRKIISLFMNEKDGTMLLSISKGIYDRFLMRKRNGQHEAKQANDAEEQRYGLLSVRGNIDDDNIKKLEKDGYIVLQTEGEAAAVSAALEESIRHGQVFGTRAFNRKFYILLRQFLERYSASITKELRGGEKKVSEIASKIGIDENGARAILYYMAETGDVSEKKRDLFVLA
ncbi:MAG: hypothetical protein QXF01_00155 [Candidatus Micrarchaeaceae archaeon]